MTMTDCAIETFALTKVYDGKGRLLVAVDHVGLSIQSGDYFTFAMLCLESHSFQYVQNSVHGLTEGIRDEQWTGAIEALVSGYFDWSNERRFCLGDKAWRSYRCGGSLS